MPETEEAMARIEGPRFAALANLASNLKTFLRILRDQPEVQHLLAEMASPAVAHQICGRALSLSASSPEPGYEHSADAAVAAYLWLLSNRDQALAEVVAKTILECDHFWWARKVAECVRSAARYPPHTGQISTAGPLLESERPSEAP